MMQKLEMVSRVKNSVKKKKLTISIYLKDYYRHIKGGLKH